MAVAAVYIFMSSGSVPEMGSPATNTQQNDQAMAQRFEQQFCGTNTSPNSNAYVNVKCQSALPSMALKCGMYQQNMAF
jgi:hypothetical protein